MYKTCTKCGESKLRSEHFNIDRSRPDGFKNHCKKCANEYSKAHRRTSKGREANRRNQLKRNYGITIEDYNELTLKQGGVCALCGKEETIGRRLAVDHCHKTGKVRGLLCQACNTGIGKLGDSIELLQKAIKYLQENQ